MELHQVIQALEQAAIRAVFDLCSKRLLQEGQPSEWDQKRRDGLSGWLLPLALVRLGKVPRQMLFLLLSLVFFSVEKQLDADGTQKRNLHREFLRDHHSELQILSDALLLFQLVRVLIQDKVGAMVEQALEFDDRCIAISLHGLHTKFPLFDQLLGVGGPVN